MRRSSWYTIGIIIIILLALVFVLLPVFSPLPALAPPTAQSMPENRSGLSREADTTSLQDYVILPIEKEADSLLGEGNVMTKKMGPTGSLIYEGLVTKGRNGTYRGWLAESWEPSQNGSVWTFHLVQNATWHDGTPCTCRDVKFTNDYMKAKNLTMSFVLSDVLNVTCPDPYTAVFTLSHSYPVFPDRLAQSPGIGVYPAHIFEKIDNPASYTDLSPIGTGPFRFRDRAPGLLRMDANPAWHGGTVHIKGVILRLLPGIDSQVLALRKGEVDVITSLPSAVAMTLAGEKNVAVYTIPDTTGYELAFNCNYYPTNITPFRMALSHAVDRDRIIVLLGSGRPNPTTFLIPAVAGDFVNPAVLNRYSYNLTLAASLLNECGFEKGRDGKLHGPDGAIVQLVMSLGGKASAGGADEKILAILREDLGRLGISVTAANYESEKEYHNAMKRGNIFIDAMPASLHDDPDDLVNFAYTPLGEENYYRYHNPVYDALAQDIRNTTNRTSRKDIGYRMQEILAEDIPTVPICSADTFAAYRTDRFIGWENEPDATGAADIRVLTVIQPVKTVGTGPAPSG